MYTIFDFLLVPAKIKCNWAAPSYILFTAGESKKSKLLYIIYSQKCHNFCHRWKSLKFLYIKKNVIEGLFFFVLHTNIIFRCLPLFWSPWTLRISHFQPASPLWFFNPAIMLIKKMPLFFNNFKLIVKD